MLTDFGITREEGGEDRGVDDDDEELDGDEELPLEDELELKSALFGNFILGNVGFALVSSFLGLGLLT